MNSVSPEIHPSKIILNRGRVTVAVAANQGSDYATLQNVLASSPLDAISLQLHSLQAEGEWWIWQINHPSTQQSYSIFSQYIAPLSLSYPEIDNPAAVTQVRQQILHKNECIGKTFTLHSMHTGTILSIADIPLLFLPNLEGEQLFAFRSPSL